MIINYSVSRHISLSPHSYSLVLFSTSLILDDTFLQVLFRNAVLEGLDVISSVNLNPYFLTNPSTDILFTKISCLMLWSFSLSSSVCSLLHTFSNMTFKDVIGGAVDIWLIIFSVSYGLDTLQLPTVSCCYYNFTVLVLFNKVLDFPIYT